TRGARGPRPDRTRPSAAGGAPRNRIRASCEHAPIRREDEPHPPPAQTSLAHQADQPPSATRFAPVTYDDASDARNTTGPTTSSAFAMRPSGMRAVYSSRNSCGWSFQTPASVNVFTRTPLRAQYVARYRVRLYKADFETEYATGWKNVSPSRRRNSYTSCTGESIP